MTQRAIRRRVEGVQNSFYSVRQYPVQRAMVFPEWRGASAQNNSTPTANAGLHEHDSQLRRAISTSALHGYNNKDNPNPYELNLSKEGEALPGDPIRSRGHKAGAVSTPKTQPKLGTLRKAPAPLVVKVRVEDIPFKMGTLGKKGKNQVKVRTKTVVEHHPRAIPRQLVLAAPPHSQAIQHVQHVPTRGRGRERNDHKAQQYKRSYSADFLRQRSLDRSLDSPVSVASSDVFFSNRSASSPPPRDMLPNYNRSPVGSVSSVISAPAYHSKTMPKNWHLSRRRGSNHYSDVLETSYDAQTIPRNFGSRQYSPVVATFDDEHRPQGRIYRGKKISVSVQPRYNEEKDESLMRSKLNYQSAPDLLDNDLDGPPLTMAPPIPGVPPSRPRHHPPVNRSSSVEHDPSKMTRIRRSVSHKPLDYRYRSK